jgi:hypothetical protein
VSNINGSPDPYGAVPKAKKYFVFHGTEPLPLIYPWHTCDLLPHKMSTSAPVDSSFTTSIPSAFSIPISEKLTKFNYPPVASTGTTGNTCRATGGPPDWPRPTAGQNYPCASRRQDRPATKPRLCKVGCSRSIGSQVSPLVAHPRSPAARHHVQHHLD